MNNEIEKGLLRVFDLWRNWCDKQIQEIAYYKWINAGCPHECDVYFWTEAEKEWWTSNKLEISAEVPPLIELNPENDKPSTIEIKWSPKISLHEDCTDYDIPPQIYATTNY